MSFTTNSPHDPVSKLIFELSKLPGIGEKTATRLAYHILKQDEIYSKSLAESILSAKQKMNLCSECFTFTDTEICRICASPERDRGQICVVEKPSDVFAVEQAGVFRGIFHVLHGVLSPLDGIGPEELKIRDLLSRLSRGTVREVILATNPSVEGEATSLYLTKFLRPMGLKVTRLAYGIPMGGMLEYTDRQTIGKALQNRVEITE